MGGISFPIHEAKMAKLREQTIEECVRMAADVIAQHRCCTDLADKIAAAIRELKDKT